MRFALDVEVNSEQVLYSLLLSHEWRSDFMVHGPVLSGLHVFPYPSSVGERSSLSSTDPTRAARTLCICLFATPLNSATNSFVAVYGGFGIYRSDAVGFYVDVEYHY